MDGLDSLHWSLIIACARPKLWKGWLTRLKEKDVRTNRGLLDSPDWQKARGSASHPERYDEL